MTSSRPTWDETWLAMAVQIGKRSLCVRDRVGAVVVSAANRIIDTGYNGPPAGFIPIVKYAPNWAEEDPGAPCDKWCPRAKSQLPDCGLRDIHPPHDECVGYPGLAYGRRLAKDYADCPSLHAEANALMFSDRRLREGGTIYVSSGTCSGCAKLVANSGLARAVYVQQAFTDVSVDTSHRNSARWYDFLRDCGLEVTLV